MNSSFVLKISTLILLSILYWNCESSSNQRNIKDYYFPIDSLANGKVYEYRAVDNDSIVPFYWYYRTTKVNGETILTSEYFDHDFVIQQLSNEEVLEDGIFKRDFFLYDTDTITGKQIPNEVAIEAADVFPFNVIDSTYFYFYKIYWEDTYPPYQKYRLIKNRHFMGNDSYPFQGKTVDCVQFFTKESLEVEADGFQELTYNSVELYAKNIGLIYFRKEIENNIVQEYELTDIFDMSELEERFRNTLVPPN